MSITTSNRTTEKRHKILEVAIRVFAREGFRNTDVQVIADQASVGKGTIYRHFESKQKLFLASAAFCLNQVGEFIEKKIGGSSSLEKFSGDLSAVEVIRKIALACAEFYQANPWAIEIMIQERAEFRESLMPSHLVFRAESRGGFDELLASAMKSGELRTVDVKQTTDAFGDMLFGCCVNGCLEGNRENLVARVEHATGLFLDGLRVHKNS